MKYDPKIHHRRSIRLKGYDYSKAGAYFITICCEKMACRFGVVTEEGMILNELGEIAYSEWIKLEERFECFELDVFQIMPNHMHGIIVLKDVSVNVGVGATLAVAQPPADNTLEIDSSLKEEESLSKEEESLSKEEESLSKEEDSSNKEDNLKEADITAKAGGGPPPAAYKKSKTTIADIIGAYKSLVSNACLEIFKSKNQRMGKLWQRDYYDHIIRDERAYINISHYIINNPAKWFDDKFYKKR